VMPSVLALWRSDLVGFGGEADIAPTPQIGRS
jgi:hypothetical protein